MPNLPWMGLGLSSNLSASGRPHPYRLRESDPRLFDYLEYSAPLALDQAEREAQLFATLRAHLREVPVLFHPVHLNLWGPELEREAALDALSAHLEAVGSPWVSNDVAWWHSAGRQFPGYLYIAPPLDRAALAECAAHATWVQSKLRVPLLLENPAVIACRGDEHLLQFMADLHDRTGCGLLIDCGHLFAHQLARGAALLDGLDRLPLDAVIEIHVAGGMVITREDRRFYIDQHPAPIRDEVLAILDHLLAKCPNLRALTYEADGHSEALAAKNLAALRPRIPAGTPAVTAPEPRAPLPVPEDMSTRAWNIFDQAFGRIPPSDPAALAELELRREIIGEKIDRAFPLTRALLDPELTEFTVSPELRRAYEPPGRELAEAFSRFARRKALEQKDEAAATLIAFETFELRESSAPGAGGRASFPIDLSELVEAAKVLRRRLRDPATIEALRQLIARAKPL